MSGHCQLSTADQPRATRKEALRYDEETGKQYKVYDGHIDAERTSWNKILIQRSVHEVYNKMLSEAINEYNAKQIANNHPERCKTVESYMQQIDEGEKKGNASSRPQLWNSCVVQCGNMLDNEAWTVINGKKVQPMLAMLSNEVYEDFVHRFEVRYGENLVPTLAVIHNDEASSHLQMHWASFSKKSKSNKRGLSIQVKLCDALAEALDRLGVKYGRKQFDNVKQAFNNDMDNLLAETMRDHGIEWIPPNITDNNLLTDKEKRRKKRKRKSINELRKEKRLLHEYLEDGVKTGDISLENIDSINVPFKGTFFSEKAVRGLVRELCKRNELLEAYHENTKELERLLMRGASASWCPFNLGSKFVMWCIKWMVMNTQYRLFTCYSDPQAKEIGSIYQGLNFYYLGQGHGTSIRCVNPYNPKAMISDRAFRARSMYKKYAKDLGIEWQKNWNNDQCMLWENVPDDIEKQLRDYSKKMYKEAKKIEFPSKHKYAFVLGKDKSETKKLRKKFLELNKIYPYPKRDSTLQKSEEVV